MIHDGTNCIVLPTLVTGVRMSGKWRLVRPSSIPLGGLKLPIPSGSVSNDRRGTRQIDRVSSGSGSGGGREDDSMSLRFSGGGGGGTPERPPKTLDLHVLL